VGLRSPHRVGRYGVDLDALDGVAVPALAPEERAVYLIGEIGKMECLSRARSPTPSQGCSTRPVP